MTKLGQLSKTDPRSVWTRGEAHDFTPWLRENIGLVAEVVGLELDLVERESRVGGFAADLFAKDLNTGRWVIIENQLERTDHGHLGQLMAYAAGKEAGVIIWISTEFRDEHRQTLDWLNEITSEEVSFFGIELELLQVDTSLPAPHFKLVSQPSEWRKAIRDPGTTTPRQQKYEVFFTELLHKVKAAYPGLTTASKAYPQSWLGLPIGRAGFSVAAAFGLGDHFRIELYIDTGDQLENKAAFGQLEQNKEAIESQIGHGLNWDRLDEKRASRISCTTSGTIEDDPARLEELQEWAIDLIGKFQKVFRPRVQKLKL